LINHFDKPLDKTNSESNVKKKEKEKKRKDVSEEKKKSCKLKIED
jgi:hypothetical protein